MGKISLQQNYDELIALETLLLDCQRRLLLADEMGVIQYKKQKSIRIIGTGFSALLAVHALRPFVTVESLYDPSGVLENDLLPNVPVFPLEALKDASPSLVIVASAPGAVDALVCQAEALAPECEIVELFSSNDSVNTVEVLDRSGRVRLNLSYRCVNLAANMARRYRPVFFGSPAPVAVMGGGLAGLIGAMGVKMAGLAFAGYVSSDDSTSGMDLLVTYAPHTIAGKEEELAGKAGCRSTQFLFREGDEDISALSIEGFSDLRLLGGGEEGYVFSCVAPDGTRCCLKWFYEEQDRSGVVALARSFSGGPHCLEWMSEIKPIPDDTATRGLYYPYVQLAHIPFVDQSLEATLRVTAGYCLQYQEAHVERNRVPSTMPGGIHALCDQEGAIRFVDVGNFPPGLLDCKPALVKAYVIKGLAGLVHETLFSGKGWANLESDENRQALIQKMDSMSEILPEWFVALLQDVLALPAENFLTALTYEELRRRYGLEEGFLPESVTRKAHALVPVDAPAPSLVEEDGVWFHECLYQRYRYKLGHIEGFGQTGSKYGLIQDMYEAVVPNSSYLDIGSNMGFFVAKAALLTDKPCNGLEKRGEFGLQANRMFKAIGVDNAQVIPVHFKPGYPLPEYDVISAFAIIHHLYLVDGAFSSFHDLVTYLSNATRKALLIEYVHNPGYTEQAEKRHGRSFADYTEGGMVEALESHFQYVVKLADVSDTRAMYIASHVSCGEDI